MGFYGCNQGTIIRDTVQGARVFVATVVHDDISGEAREQRLVVPGWELSSLMLCTQWLHEKLMQLSM